MGLIVMEIVTMQENPNGLKMDLMDFLVDIIAHMYIHDIATVERVILSYLKLVMFVTAKSVCKVCNALSECTVWIYQRQAESHDSGNALISGRILIKDDKCQSAWVISALIRLRLIRMLSDALISNTVTHKEPHSHLKLRHQPLIAHGRSVYHTFI